MQGCSVLSSEIYLPWLGISALMYTVIILPSLVLTWSHQTWCEEWLHPRLAFLMWDAYEPHLRVLFALSFRPFHVEPRNIVEDDAQERVSAEAAVLSSRVHYYGRLTASSDRLLVCHCLLPISLQIPMHVSNVLFCVRTNKCGNSKKRFIRPVVAICNYYSHCASQIWITYF